MQFMGVLNRYFIYWVLLALFFYASIQFYYLSHGIFTTDDFWLAFVCRTTPLNRFFM
jgi:hypothetical protein